jgi:tRNA(His) 5'-end guanylyltransferase
MADLDLTSKNGSLGSATEVQELMNDIGKKARLASRAMARASTQQKMQHYFRWRKKSAFKLNL